MPPRITHPDGEKGARGEAAAGKVDPHCDGGTGGGGGAADGAARRAARLLCGGLALTSRFPKLRASGHACGVAGPAALLVYFRIPAFISGMIILALTWWASLRMKRHTAGQLLGGTVIPVAVILVLTFLEKITL